VSSSFLLFFLIKHVSHLLTDKIPISEQKGNFIKRISHPILNSSFCLFFRPKCFFYLFRPSFCSLILSNPPLSFFLSSLFLFFFFHQLNVFNAFTSYPTPLSVSSWQIFTGAYGPNSGYCSRSRLTVDLN